MAKDISEYIHIFALGLMIFVVGLMAVLSARHSTALPLFFWDHPATAEKAATASDSQAVDAGLGQKIDHVTVSPSSRQAVPPHAAALAAALVPGCSLSLSVVPASKVIVPGGVIDYSVRVKNNGRDACQNTSLSFYYPGNEAFVSASLSSASGGYYWRIGTLASSAEYAFSLQTKYTGTTDAAQIQDEACATADNVSGDACADNLIFVDAHASDASSNASGATATTNTSPVSTPQPPQIAPQTGVAYNPPQGKEFGTWIWDSPILMAPGYAPHILQAAHQEGFSSVYVTIDDYLDIAVLPAGPDKEAAKQSYMDALAAFVLVAKAQGISVDAEGGWRDWASSANRWKGYTLIDFVKEYNQNYPQAKVRNLQYDVEPYLFPAYENHKASILKEYISFIDESAARMQNVDAGFSIVIPHFYDSVDKWTPPISYGGKTQYTFTHLLSVLKQKSDSSIIIMAYRNFFEGSNGVRDISETEIKEASDGGYPTKIIVAQETGNVDPPYVTFYGYSKSAVLSAFDQIYAGFGGYADFGGISVHYIEPYLALQ